MYVNFASDTSFFSQNGIKLAEKSDFQLAFRMSIILPHPARKVNIIIPQRIEKGGQIIKTARPGTTVAEDIRFVLLNLQNPQNIIYCQGKIFSAFISAD